MSKELLLDKVIDKVTGGKYGVEVNPEFEELWAEVLKEDRNIATRIYDMGTLVIIDDQKHKLVPKFNLVRKK